MSIQSEIERIEGNIADTYSELAEQGADMPPLLNSDNLAATAATTKTVKYIAQSLTAAQQAQARTNIGAVSEEDLPNAFYVTVTPSPESETYIPDKSLAEIIEAYELGKPVYCIYPIDDSSNFIAPLNAVSTGMALFSLFANVAIGIMVFDGIATVQQIALVTEEDLRNDTYDVVRYSYQLLTRDEKVQTRENIGVYSASVKDYGAKGNNSTDDTTAFRNALAAERVVYVPGGKYKLSGELTLGSNCQLELAQDAVLYFTQTTGNCISMKMSANIVGNHATISVPYAFAGKVINIDGSLNSSVTDIPPFTQWDPMWKTARFITDLNIVKPDTRGFYYSMDGKCNGIAVYLCADYSDTSSFIWATNLARLRIAGAFTYGVFAEAVQSGGSGWIHQMRVDGFIDGAEVGLYLKNIEDAFASVIVLPRRAFTTAGEYIPYAKWGIALENCECINLLGSRVMDWNSTYSLWAEGNINQHIALLGNCRDIKMEDHLYYAMPMYDIRSLIYTDNPSNLETLTILEEPFTRWFKPIDHVPYFNDGFIERKLILQEDLDRIVDANTTVGYTNILPTAKDTSGNVYNGTGYRKYGFRLDGNGGEIADPYWGCTGFIPVKRGDVVYAKNLKLGTNGYTIVTLLNSTFGKVAAATGTNIFGSTYHFGYETTEDGFKLTVKETSAVAYVRFSYPRENIGDNPIISVNNPIAYSTTGYLRDGIKVKAENIEGDIGGGVGDSTETWTFTLSDGTTVTKEVVIA